MFIFELMSSWTLFNICPIIITYYVHVGNRQKKAKALIEACGLRMMAVEDFDSAARTVSCNICNTTLFM